MSRSDIESLAARLRSEPSSIEARVALADALAGDGHVSEAIELYRRGAKMLAARGDFASSLSVCKAILGLDPEHRAALAQVADLLRKSGGSAVRPFGNALPAQPHLEIARSDFHEEVKRHARGPRLLTLAASLDADEDITSVRDPDRFRDETLSGVAAEAKSSATRAERPKAKKGSRDAALPRWDPIPESEIVRLPPDPKELQGFQLFADLPLEALAELVNELERVKVPAGQVVVRQGDMGDAFYLVLSGRLSVDRAGRTVGQLASGEFFGEVAMLADRRRHATVQATEDAELLRVRSQTLEGLMRKHRGVARTVRHFYDQRLLATLVATAPVFATCPESERTLLIEQFGLVQARPGERILVVGQPGAGLFLVLVGAVQVVRDRIVLATLEEGSYFGEMSILAGRPVSADVEAKTKTELAFLPATQFVELVGRNPTLWQEMQNEAERRALYNHAILVGEVAS